MAAAEEPAEDEVPALEPEGPPALGGCNDELLSFLEDSADGIMDPMPELAGTEVEREARLLVTLSNKDADGREEDDDESVGCRVDDGWREGVAEVVAEVPAMGTACCAAIPE